MFELILRSIANYRTTVLGLLIFLVGVLPQLSKVLEVITAILQTGELGRLPELYAAAIAFATAAGMFVAKDSTTGSVPQ